MSLQIDPSWVDYAERGKCYFDLGEYDDALDDLNDALAIFPENTDVLVNRARCTYLLSEYGTAIEDCSRALDLEPEYWLALLWRGRCYFQTKQYNLALNDFSRGIAVDPDQIWWFVERGITYQELKQYKEAIYELNKAIDLARRDAKEYNLPMHEEESCIAAFKHRGKCYEMLKMHEERIDNEKEASTVGINIEDCDDD
jgi:tetratricopeptide (TPR) repeat protein